MAKGKNNTRKQNEKKIESVGGFDGDIKGKIIAVICILCFFGAFYLLTLYITSKNTEKTDDDTKEEVTISYDNILLGRSLSMADGEYLVICYDKSNEDINSKYSQLVSNYKYKEEHLNIYTVDMSVSFNKKFATDGESNKTPSVDSFAINGPTLIKVSDHNVAEYIEGEEAISSYLG